MCKMINNIYPPQDGEIFYAMFDAYFLDTRFEEFLAFFTDLCFLFVKKINKMNLYISGKTSVFSMYLIILRTIAHKIIKCEMALSKVIMRNECGQYNPLCH